MHFCQKTWDHFIDDLKEYKSFRLVSSDEKRDRYIDFVRGLVAISVIYIHTVFWSGTDYVPEIFRMLALLFDVPVFFFCSGMSFAKTKRPVAVISSVFRLSIAFTLLAMIMDILCLNLTFRNTISTFLLEGRASLLPLVSGSYWFVKPFVASLIFLGVFISFYYRYIPVLFFILLISYPLAMYGLIPFDFAIRPYSCFIAFTLFGYWVYDKGFLKYGKSKFLSGSLAAGLAVLFITIACLHQGFRAAVDLQSNKFPVNVSYIGASFIAIAIIIWCHSDKLRLPECICKIGRDSIWFYAGQSVGSSILIYVAPAVKITWEIKLPLMFLLNFILSFASAIILHALYTLLCSINFFNSAPDRTNQK